MHHVLTMLIIGTWPIAVWWLITRRKVKDGDMTPGTHVFRVSPIALTFFLFGVLMGISFIFMGLVWSPGSLLTYLLVFPFGGFMVFAGIVMMSRLSRTYVKVDDTFIVAYDGKHERRERLLRVQHYYRNIYMLEVIIGGTRKPMELPILFIAKAHMLLALLEEHTGEKRKGLHRASHD